MVWARVADHHPVDRSGVLEVGFRAAEAPGVLIDVEQQHHAAPKPPAVSRSRAATWVKMAAPAFESAEPRPYSHPSAIFPEAGG
jgi:hypothetical protein